MEIFFVRGSAGDGRSTPAGVIALLADGMRYRGIADRLGISEGQVQRHVARAGATNATQLVAATVRERIVPSPGQTTPIRLE